MSPKIPCFSNRHCSQIKIKMAPMAKLLSVGNHVRGWEKMMEIIEDGVDGG